MVLSIRSLVIRRDSLLVLLAAVNLLVVYLMMAMTCDHGRIDWPCDLAIFPFPLMAPGRLLAATACLWARRWWTEVAGVLISVQMVIGAYICTLPPDFLRVEWNVSSHVLQTSLTQTVLAAALTLVACVRVTNRLRRGAGRTAAILTAASVALLAGAGYVSNVVSQAAAERDVAKLLYAEAVRRGPFNASTARSFERFRDAGLAVGATSDVSPQHPYAAVGLTGFIAPFALDVHYEYYNDRDDHFQRTALVVAFFGRTRLVAPDSNVWAIRLNWWMFPY
jgi:hypothetical protein